MRFIILFAITLFYQCGNAQSYNFKFQAHQPPSHAVWTELLSKNVDEKGKVNYRGFIGDSTKLNSYLETLSKNPPHETKWTKEDQIAYWINAYNAFTVQLIIRNYPVESIKDIGGKIPFINSSWDIKFIAIGGEVFDLNNLEHGILRKYFNEPRIHFAVNCASISCPKLRNEAYEGKKLNAQLSDQTKSFLADTSKNKFLSAEKAELSKLFKWFTGDFTKNESLISFINRYAPKKLNKDADIDYLEYNWSLNE
ncbi:DUF547 domain-containing protein [Luteibaculum oceani]|uniref:DUF547 domain-containing protein n=1 Tax=Luteibaculum oceani TaxID=1294296 RepID=A0A5C6V1W3_9FLAO|nr:DUF547 domain-containing protein [Luteibaculum oceani]TXC76995.1 DUF547 domain-containing protein [Luteibaculum oceani]